MSFEQLPPTVNFHVVGHCNYKCRGCYARFEEAKTFLALADATSLLAEMRAHGVTRVTFAGGEPTLHPELLGMLAHASRIGLVTSLVSNASLIDEPWCAHHLPWLRWLVFSCDSVVRETSDRLGRSLKRDREGQPARVLRVSRLVQRWNRVRPPAERVRLKINMVVSRLTQDEDPNDWLSACNPERVKLMQCLILRGENEDARDLACEDEAFAAYAARVQQAQAERRVVIAERASDLQRSYATIDPRGCFRQSHPTGYLTSERILEVGVATAWRQAGGFDAERFRARGGVYEHGVPATGARARVIAIEGLDGSGKSTLVRALAETLGAVIARNPPPSLAAARVCADALPERERRAFYRRANAETMRLAMERVFAGSQVVMDRCFASTLAYGAAAQATIASSDDVPTRRPDHMIFLSLPEAERRRRLAARAEQFTDEERRLSSDHPFRERVIAGYRALGCRFVDASRPVDEIVRTVLEIVR